MRTKRITMVSPIRNLCVLAALLGAGFFLPDSLGASTAEWRVRSPDRACSISVSLTDGSLAYETHLKGRPMVLKSPLGLQREDADFYRELTFVSAGPVESRREVYDLFTGPRARVSTLLNTRRLAFRNRDGMRLELELAASGEGVAFRYRFPESSSVAHGIDREWTGFHVPAKSRGFLQPYHAAGDYTPAYEDFYFQVAPGEQPPESRGKPIGWSFPALFRLPGNSGSMLITESGTEETWCACHLASDSTDGTYRIAFPAANEFTKGQTNALSAWPRGRLPWTSPWRVILMATEPGDIATSTLVTDLAPPSRIADTSWIKPGRAAWAWWSFPDGPSTAAMFNQFTDFAAEMNWEYTLFDAGWWKPGLGVISDYALEKGVLPLVWMFAGDFYNPRQASRKLDEAAKAGARGVKVDFWCSDRQEAIAAMHRLFQEAAERQLLVNLHGCTIPRGWQRTWPNFLTAEAVLGTECYFYEPHYTTRAAELNTILPFTRNVAGPMDVTPVACSPKKFARTTTAAHELATSILFTSGLIHYADSPEFFKTLPKAAIELLRDAPARWDETRCLIGEPGQVVVFARRSGSEWFVAGINGTGKSLPVTLKLSDLGTFEKQTLISEDASDPAMGVKTEELRPGRRWKHTMPARGGFVLRMRS